MVSSDSPILFVATLWWVWVWRNQMIFSNEPYSIEGLVRSIQASHDDYLTHCSTPSLARRHARLIATWRPPPAGKVKLNTDGSALPDSQSIGSGGLLRDNKGDWIRGFSSFDGVGDPLLAELFGILHGLALALDLGYKDLVCESDCLEAVTLLHSKGLHRFHRHASILAAIMMLMERGVSVEFVHVVREVNACADFLAKQGVRASTRRHIWITPPSDMESLLLKDVLDI